MKKQLTLIFSFTLLFVTQLMSAQSSSVSGFIYDQSGKAIPGVNVVEKGTSNGTSTNYDGSYVIKVSSPKSVLVFSTIGYTSKQVTVGQNKTLNVTLQDEVSSLKEVVVVGYGTAKKKDLTGAITSGNLKQFQEAPNTNILQSLGSLPGVGIGQSNQAGADPVIRIRGQNSINGNIGVLIVLDGAVYRGKFTDINPKDVQSVDILKDPSSKAIYGAQAANGVMMITTKKGKKGSKAVIDYSTFYAIQDPIKNRKVLNRAQFEDMARTANYNTPGVPQAFLPNTNYTQPNPAWNYINNSGGSIAPILVNSWNAGTDYDWYGEATNGSMYTVDHNLSLRGSTESTTFFLSGGFTDQLGWVINDNYQRKSIRVNVENKPKDWLTLGANAFGAFSDRSGLSPDLVALSLMHPAAAPKDANGNYIVNPMETSTVNPFLQTQQDNLDEQNNISLLLYAGIDIPGVKGLNYRINYSNNYRWNKYFTSSIFNGGSASKSNNSIIDTTLDNILSYNRRFGADEKHGLNLTAVIGSNSIDYEGTVASATQFSNLSLSYNSLEQGLIPKVTSDAWAEDFRSQTARVVYDYDGKYFINGSIRRDGYSGFAANNKWGTFPSFGLGWNITKENFLANTKKIDLLKLRFSYGENGNTTSRYSSLARFNAEAANQYIFGDGSTTVNGISPANLANPNLTWETTIGYNIGFDFGFLDNRITGTIDAYKSDTEDLLWDLPIPSINGFNSIRSNIGGLQNRGIEVALNFTPLRTTDWEWSFGINYAKNENEVTSLFGKDIDGNGQEDDLFPVNADGSGGLYIGKSIGTIYQYVEDGIYQFGDVIPAGFSVGGYRLKDIAGNPDGTPDGQITPADRTFIGTTQPDYQIGFTNSLTWKNFSLKFFINSVQGGIAANNPWGGTAGGLGVYANTSTIVINNRYDDIDSWSPTNPGAEFAMAGTTTGTASFTPYRDRSFIRLNDISFSYEMDKNLIGKSPFSKVKLFIAGKNLYTISDWKGWDPETAQGLEAISNTGLPVMKSVSFGLDLSF